MNKLTKVSGIFIILGLIAFFSSEKLITVGTWFFGISTGMGIANIYRKEFA